MRRTTRVVRELAKNTEFYAMYGIGDYSFAKFRVVWKRMASRLEAAVLSSIKTDFGIKKIISTDTTSLFAVDDKDEAHYLCGLINSNIVDEYIKSFSEAGRGFGAPSIMKNLAIPKYNAKNRLHGKLAELSEKAHDLVRSGKSIEGVQEEIDATARRIWNIE